MILTQMHILMTPANLPSCPELCQELRACAWRLLIFWKPQDLHLGVLGCGPALCNLFLSWASGSMQHMYGTGVQTAPQVTCILLKTSLARLVAFS